MYLMKTELGIDTSINSTAKIFNVSEKKLRQGLKGVKYHREGDEEVMKKVPKLRQLHLVTVKMKELLLS